jgi:hypothetical protein
MNNSAIYPRRTACVSAILEFKPKKLAAKIKEAVRVIHERMKDPIQLASPEYQAIQDALRAIGVRTCFAAVLFEKDQDRFGSRIAEASRAIDERLQSAAEVGSIERISIETAQRSLAAMEREPFSAPRRRVEQTVTADEKSGADDGIKPALHDVGSRVRFTMPSGKWLQPRSS